MAPTVVPDPMLAAVIRRVREEREQTQEDLAFETALSVGAVGRIERGAANPTWTTVRAFAEALGLSMEELGRLIDAEGSRT